ncbi:MAG: 3-keto-5-aminohexanoate cleavage protein [Candidatus Cloacimonadota bacterium]|nr:MAG: 3-keto-5-aminohexanoate cleavage protein [Candidatus Cloacimonadota bacterium]
MKPLIISCPIIGAELTKEDYPYLPTTPDELAQAAFEAVEQGATIIHLHVRDKNGKPSQRVDIFQEVSKKIKDRCECILQYSTGGAVGTPLSDRIAPLSLKPEMATLSMGSLNFGNEIFENTQDIIVGIAKSMVDNNVMPELEIFDYGMMDTVDRFVKKGLIPEHYHIDFVLGVPGGMNGEIKSLIMLLDRISKSQTWTVAGVGRFQLPLATHAIMMGGNIRIGIEDNIFYRKGEMAKTNAQLIERFVKIAHLADREIATLEQTRQILKLS